MWRCCVCGFTCGVATSVVLRVALLRLWFYVWRSSFGASGRLCFMCVTFPGCPHILWGGCQNATRFYIPHFNNPFSCYQTNNYLTNNFHLTLITLFSAFKHISLIQSDAYKWRINAQDQRKLQTFEKVRLYSYCLDLVRPSVHMPVRGYVLL